MENISMSVRCYANHPSGRSPSFEALVVVLPVLVVTICLTNGLVIVLLLRAPSLRTKSNFFLGQLAIADFSMGPMLVYNIITLSNGSIVFQPYRCVLRTSTLVFSAWASLCGLAGVTCDRYLAITQPMRYLLPTPSSRYICYAALIWFPPFVLGFLLPSLWYNECPVMCDFVLTLKMEYLRYILLPTPPVVGVLMVAMYSRIFHIARLHARRVMELPAGTNQVNLDSNGNGNFKTQLKIVKTAFAVFAIFYISWMPFLTILCLQIYGSDLYNTALGKARTLAMAVVAMNSVCNPLIYGLSLSDFRLELKRMFRKERSA